MKFMTFASALATVLLLAPVVQAADAPKLKVHPKVFSMVECWISDSEAPVVTEFNLDALEANDDQFFADDVKREDGWTACPGEDGTGFLRYKVVDSRDNWYKVEFQSNGGGTLTTASVIECSIEKREIKRDGKPTTIRVLRVLGYSVK